MPNLPQTTKNRSATQVPSNPSSQLFSDKHIIQLLDQALLEGNEASYVQAFTALWDRAYAYASQQVHDPDEAQDLVQEAMLAVYRTTQNHRLTGSQIVGLVYAKLQGWQGVPGLINKHQAQYYQRLRMEQSLHSKPTRDGVVNEFSAAVSLPLRSQFRPISSPEQTQRRAIEAKIQSWRQKLTGVRNKAEYETLQAMLTYVEAALQHHDGSAATFKVVIGRFKRRWRIPPPVMAWFRLELGLKQEAALCKRLLRIYDLYLASGLKKTDLKRQRLADVIVALETEAKWLWYDPLDQQTLRALCRWLQEHLDQTDQDSIRLPSLLIQEETQLVLDQPLSRFLQEKLQLRQNTVRKRVDRVMDLLSTWGLMEDIKDE